MFILLNVFKLILNALLCLKSVMVFSPNKYMSTYIYTNFINEISLSGL